MAAAGSAAWLASRGMDTIVLLIAELGSLPVVLVAVLPAALTLLGVLIGSVITRKNARELEARSQRTESMQMLRWAVEMASEHDESKALIGRLVLEQLAKSNMVHDDDRDLAVAVVWPSQQDQIALGIGDHELASYDLFGAERRDGE
jgi:hypothetical protein